MAHNRCVDAAERPVTNKHSFASDIGAGPGAVGESDTTSEYLDLVVEKTMRAAGKAYEVGYSWDLEYLQTRFTGGSDEDVAGE